MKLPPTYSIAITGSTIGVINQNAADHGHRLQYLLNRLLCGFEVADGAFEVYGLKVEVIEE